MKIQGNPRYPRTDHGFGKLVLATCWNAWNSIAGVTTNNSSSNEAFRKRPWEYKRPNFFVRHCLLEHFLVFEKKCTDLAVVLKCAQDQLEKITDSNWSSQEAPKDVKFEI